MNAAHNDDFIYVLLIVILGLRTKFNRTQKEVKLDRLIVIHSQRSSCRKIEVGVCDFAEFSFHKLLKRGLERI